jgi:hypothetical protein
MKQLLLVLFATFFSFQFATAQLDEINENGDSPTEVYADTEPLARIEDAPAKILPLPNNQFKIILPAPAPGGGVAVYDLLGNSTIQETFGQQIELNLDLSQFKHGVYFVKVLQPGQMITKRIVVR